MCPAQAGFALQLLSDISFRCCRNISELTLAGPEAFVSHMFSEPEQRIFRSDYRRLESGVKPLGGENDGDGICTPSYFPVQNWAFRSKSCKFTSNRPFSQY